MVPALDPNTPIYAGLFTMQLIQRRMKEFNLWGDGSRFKVIEMGERFQAAPFEMEAVCVTHSIPDCCGLIFRCSAGTIVHTGDWKIDESPVDGIEFDRTAWERVGKEVGPVAASRPPCLLKTRGFLNAVGDVGESRVIVILPVGKEVGPVTCSLLSSCLSSNQRAACEARAVLVGRDADDERLHQRAVARPHHQ